MFKVNDKVKTIKDGYNITGVITAIIGNDVVIDYSGIGTGDRKLRTQIEYIEKV
jgi:hypothetical protein